LAVDLVTTLQFDQINNQFIVPFFTDNPNGIDGITNLENRTIVFINQDSDPETGGWQQTTFFDPLLNVGNVESGTGSFDSTTFSQTTNITDQATQYSVWRIQYLTAVGGGTYMSLQFVENVDLENKFTVGLALNIPAPGGTKMQMDFLNKFHCSLPTKMFYFIRMVPILK
jgi:hypothetical protein